MQTRNDLSNDVQRSAGRPRYDNEIGIHDPGHRPDGQGGPIDPLVVGVLPVLQTQVEDVANLASIPLPTTVDSPA